MAAMATMWLVLERGSHSIPAASASGRGQLQSNCGRAALDVSMRTSTSRTASRSISARGIS